MVSCVNPEGAVIVTRAVAGRRSSGVAVGRALIRESQAGSLDDFAFLMPLHRFKLIVKAYLFSDVTIAKGTGWVIRRSALREEGPSQNEHK